MGKIIIANWKMNPESANEARTLFATVKEGLRDVRKTEVVICPPFLYLALLKGLQLGAQNVFYREKGAYTGEVSPSMLKDLGIRYVIIGHSEARKYLQETDEIIHKKLQEALQENLKPIFCVGEKEEEKAVREALLERQITEGLGKISADEAKNIIIAYEPVWAIGTGNNCSVRETDAAVARIREIITGLYGASAAREVRVVYGGSVNRKNSEEYIESNGVDGLLVGGASLKAEEFIAIVRQAESAR